MNKIKIKPGALNGTVSVPPSKSAAHRAIICAALSDGTSVIEPVELSNDIKATIQCMKKLGAEISLDGKTLTVSGSRIFSSDNIQLDCGSTLRFLIPVAAAGGVSAEFVGHGKLPERPIGVFTECLPQHNVECITKGGLPLKIKGRLESGKYYVPGNISSQFITGLLLALPLADGDSEIILTSGLQSGDYINMTVDTMKAFGVEVSSCENGWRIKGGQRYKAVNFKVEGDWSQAAFFMTAAALGGKITIDNLDINSRQGDKACMEIYSRFGARITLSDNGNIGTTVIKGAERLRIKECDRLAAMRDGLSRLGADITETSGGFIINGRKKLNGAEVSGYNDHRIVMSLTVAAVCADGDIIITCPESVNKSYPDFFEVHRKLGGCSDVIMGQ